MKRHIKKPKTRNPYAESLSQRKYQQRVVKDKKKHLLDMERRKDTEEELKEHEV